MHSHSDFIIFMLLARNGEFVIQFPFVILNRRPSLVMIILHFHKLMTTSICRKEERQSVDQFLLFNINTQSRKIGRSQRCHSKRCPKSQTCVNGPFFSPTHDFSVSIRACKQKNFHFFIGHCYLLRLQNAFGRVRLLSTCNCFFTNNPTMLHFFQKGVQ